jgi:hypothetical protein
MSGKSPCFFLIAKLSESASLIIERARKSVRSGSGLIVGPIDTVAVLIIGIRDNKLPLAPWDGNAGNLFLRRGICVKSGSDPRIPKMFGHNSAADDEKH